MKTVTLPGIDEIAKFQGVMQAFPEVWDGRVLDVGCRTGKLQGVLARFNGNVDYYGVDLYPPARVIADLGFGLPFENASFDLVVALDVIEHTDNAHNAFAELCRVARKHVLIVLPNAYDLGMRIRFAFGRPISGKYGLPTIPPSDRHRWFFSLHEAKNFTESVAPKHGFDVIGDGCLIGPRRRLFSGALLVKLFPNLLSSSYVALLGRKQSIAHEG